MKVFVTGSSSHLACALLPRLCALENVECVTGIDRCPPRYSHAKFRAVELDIRDPRAPALMAEHDALVHLACIVLRGRTSEREMFDVNVTASYELLQAARRAGIGRLIHMSSAAVYGSGVHLDESAPLRPLPGFLYGRYKARLEEMLAARIPECVRLRPHVILGPNAQPLLKWLLAQPCYVRVPDPQPLLQCVHEDDVARAIVLAIERNVRGPFNLAAADRFGFRDIVRLRHRVSVPLPYSAVRAASYLAWRVAGLGGEPGWTRGLAETLVIDCRRAQFELGWQPTRDAHSILSARGTER